MMKHLFSDVKAFRRDPLSFVLERGSCSPDSFARLHLGLQRYYLACDKDVLKSVLKADEEKINKGRLVNKLRPIVGNSSLVSSGPDQKRRRAAIHSRMARGTVDPLVPELSTAIRASAAVLAREESFVASEVTGPLALSMIAVVLFGHNVLTDGDKQALLEAIRLVEDELADEMFRAFPMTPRGYFRRKRCLSQSKAIMTFVVQRVRKKAASSSVIRELESLGLSDEEIRDEILTMLIAGHHTTGSAAAWILYHLAIDHDLANNISREAGSICDNHGEIRPALLKTATVSYALVREVLRLHPSVWWFARETKQVLTIAGQRLEKGSSLVISPWQLHRDPRYWANPEEFRLDRDYASAAYVPFGFGPRACVGMGVALLNLQLFALEFSAAYHLSLSDQQQGLRPRASITLVPPRIQLKLQQRELENIVHAAA